MVSHFIAIQSSYVQGKRIGWHSVNEDEMDKDHIRSFLIKYKRECGNVHLGIHKLKTDRRSKKSIAEKDKFFEDVIFTSDIDEFINIAKRDGELVADDVARFILSMLPVSHLKLQKLIYLATLGILRRPERNYSKNRLLHTIMVQLLNRYSENIELMEETTLNRLKMMYSKS
ncbi:phage-associated protein [Geomicrobium sp. JCM 19037]|nr:phage-associated protein [Geomicrobium sp. JCM 19037]